MIVEGDDPEIRLGELGYPFLVENINNQISTKWFYFTTKCCFK